MAEYNGCVVLHNIASALSHRFSVSFQASDHENVASSANSVGLCGVIHLLLDFGRVGSDARYAVYSTVVLKDSLLEYAAFMKTSEDPSEPPRRQARYSLYVRPACPYDPPVLGK